MHQWTARQFWDETSSFQEEDWLPGIPHSHEELHSSVWHPCGDKIPVLLADLYQWSQGKIAWYDVILISLCIISFTDHLELFLFSVRSRHGSNNNPRPRGFISSYKQLFLYHDIRTNRPGNCSSQDRTMLLTAKLSNFGPVGHNEDLQFVHQHSHLENVRPCQTDHDYVDMFVWLLLGSLLRIDAQAEGRSNPGSGLFLPRLSGKHLSA